MSPGQFLVSWEVHMPCKNGEIRFKIDTGADVSVIPEEDMSKLGLTKKDIRRTRKKLYGPGRKRLQCLGYVITQFTWGDQTGQQLIYVCRGIKRALLGKPAIRKFNIVELKVPKNYSCAEVNQVVNDTAELGQEEVTPSYPLLKEFPQLYNRLGLINAGDAVNIKLKVQFLIRLIAQDTSRSHN